ncbi:hypothetical protein TWF506_001930 [Arthrobotrys conoides]|uniref:RING-type domain-containing protein n=1 Tax=Arthrobotrys conoides TaxID=74498 RepID=A0AAN8P3N4_9PEZI
MEVIDLTIDFEEETASRRQQDRQRRESEPILLHDSDEAVPSPVRQTPVKQPILTPSTNPPKSTPRNSNTKKPKSTGKKKIPSIHTGWRAGIIFEEVETIPPVLTPKEQKKRQKEVEEKEIGNRIQKLAESVGWKQPHRNDDRKTRKNSTATPYLYNEERLAVCDICGDKAHIFEMTKLKCKHRHCKSCLEENFLMVINDPNGWPAKCCKPLEQDLALNTLCKEDFQRYLDVKREKEQMSSTNCFNCNGAIPSINVMGSSTAFCARCERITCVHCTKAMHEGACLLDPETEKLLNMAQGKKWSKCPKCSNMVERNTGCNSIMCRCGINFCYKCGREMSLCSTRGGCNQIAFQSGMWQNQAPHQPMQVNPQMINGYRERSMKEESQLQKQWESMADQNAKAVGKQQVASEILALRAKLENKPDKRNSGSPNSKSSASNTPAEKKTPMKMEDYKQSFPALMKVFEESKSQQTSPPPRPPQWQPQPQSSKSPSSIERNRESYPALLKNNMPNPAPQTVNPQRQSHTPAPPISAPTTNSDAQSTSNFVLNMLEPNPFLSANNANDYIFDFSDEEDFFYGFTS